MGSPTDTTFANALAPRIVMLSPFWLDAHEITVAELRASGIREGVELHSGSLGGARYQDFCTFTADPGRFEDHPANCVSFAAARATCAARSGDVPSEAQYEYVMSGLTALPFVWGRDRAQCREAVLGRGPRSELFSNESAAFHRECLPEPDGDPAFEQLGFPKPITRASLGRDVLVLEGGAIQDLAGGVTEWAADGWERRDGGCWNAGTMRNDPVCPASAGGLRVLRGGSWTAPPDGLPAWWREPHPAAPESSGISIGFRCAYPGR